MSPPVDYRQVYGDALEFDALDRYYQRVYEQKQKEKKERNQLITKTKGKGEMLRKVKENFQIIKMIEEEPKREKYAKLDIANSTCIS